MFCGCIISCCMSYDILYMMHCFVLTYPNLQDDDLSCCSAYITHVTTVTLKRRKSLRPLASSHCQKTILCPSVTVFPSSLSLAPSH